MKRMDYDRTLGNPKYNNYSEEHNPFSITVDQNSSLFYEIGAPMQITLACCSGTGKDDYVNFYTISTEKSFYYQQTYTTQNNLYHKQPLHYHDYFELAIVLEGSIVQNIEDKEYLYVPGSCCFINRSLRHAELFLTKGTVLFVGVSTQLMEELLAIPDHFFPTEKEAIRDTLLHQFVLSDLSHPGIKAYLDYIPTTQNRYAYPFLHDFSQNIIKCCLSPSYGTTYHVKGLLCSLLSKFCDSAYYHCTQMQLNFNADYLIFSRIRHLLEESDGRMARKDLAAALHYSGDYINRIVKKYTHMCLYDYGMTFCIKKAAVLLTTTNDSISSIALQLRFSNRTHFYQLFQAAYGMTPREYRQQALASATAT